MKMHCKLTYFCSIFFLWKCAETFPRGAKRKLLPIFNFPGQANADFRKPLLHKNETIFPEGTSLLVPSRMPVLVLVSFDGRRSLFTARALSSAFYYYYYWCGITIARDYYCFFCYRCSLRCKEYGEHKRQWEITVRFS